MKKKFALLLSMVTAASMAQAADISWNGGTADYTSTANWVGGVVPGASDSAINDTGTNNAVRISVGNPDWAVNQIRAGNGAGDGTFTQNGQAVNLTGTNSGTSFLTSVRLGGAAGNTGLYNLNGGSINYSNGAFNVGELGTGILNISGGVITGTGNFADNLGSTAIPTAVNATAGNGVSEGDFTWFEQGLYTPNASFGLPAAGTTIVSLSQADHSFNLPPTYIGNNDVMVESNVPNAAITFSPAALGTSLSFLCMAGNGATVVSYVVHHADSTTETGTLTIPDWFGPGTAAEVMSVGARVDALGINFQFPGSANGFTGNAPYIWSLDLPVTSSSAVTSINFAWVSGGVANIFGVSGQTTGGGAFTPLTISGFNKDVIVEAGAATRVSSSVTDYVNQTNGAVNVTGNGLVLIGNVGNGVYNLIGGSINASNNISVGATGGTGTLNLAGGTFSQGGGGTFRIGDSGVGVVNQTGGTIVTYNNEVWMGQSTTGNGTYNLSAGSLICSNWLALGREGGTGVLNISGGSVFKAGGGNLTITHGTGASGTINQTGGSITIAAGEVWIGEDTAAGTWNISAGTANVGLVHIAQNGNATGRLNLNGGTMTAQEVTTGNTTGGSAITFNGGTLRPQTNNATFLHDITLANLSAGGAIFDSAGYNITVSEALPNNGGDGSGGLTKNGLGTLTLTGLNTYTGPTVVNAGILAVDTTSSAGGSYAAADGATLSVGVKAPNAQLNMSGLTLGSSAGASLNVDVSTFGNPVAAPLNVSGALTVNGTITVNLADGTPQLGQFPLIKYGSKTGSGTFVLGPLPTGVTANIVDNTGNSSIDVVFTVVNAPRWEGQAGGNWDIGLTTNWINIGNGQPTFYTDGSPVVFDDNATGTTNVNLVTTVTPGQITINNSTLNYAISGSGKISGNIGLNKQGTATLALVNTGGNNFTGPTTLTAGTLSVASLANGGVPSAIGASSASPTNVVFAGGKLSYTGPSTAINRGYKVAADGSSLETVGDLTLSGVVQGSTGTFNKTGLGQLTYAGVASSNILSDFNAGTYLLRAGTLVLDGSAGAQTNFCGNLNVGSDAGVNPTVVLTNTTLRTRTLQLGNNVNCTGTLILNGNSTMTIAANNFAVGLSPALGSPSAGVLTQNPGSALDSSAELWVGQGPSGTGTYNMNGGTAIFRNWVAIGRNGGAATFNMTGGTITKTPNNNFMIGSRDGTTGTVGTLNQSGGTILCGSEYWIGEAQNNASAAFGTNNISGTATLIVSNWIAIGRESAIGVLNLSGGSVTKLGTSGNNIEIGNGTGSTGIINQTGGAFNNTISETRVGTGAPGYWNMSGGTANLAGLVFCNNSGCTNGTLNFNGGVITAKEIRANQTGVANVSTLNFNGGTMVAASGASTNFLHNLTAANVQSGGATIDSSTNIINISQALLNGGGGGGLTKVGNGTLRLNGVNTYTGTTLVSVGTLGGTGTIAGPVNVASGATLAPGVSIGTLTINNSLTLSNSSTTFVEVSLDGGVTNNDLVTDLTGVTYAGSLVVKNVGATALVTGNVFKLFNSTPAGTGNFASVTIQPAGSGTFNPATGEVTITSTGAPTLNSPTVSGGNLILTGTGGAGTGYTLLSSTNIALPLAQWDTNTTGTFSGTGTASNAIPLSTTNRFFLLRQP